MHFISTSMYCITISFTVNFDGHVTSVITSRMATAGVNCRRRLTIICTISCRTSPSLMQDDGRVHQINCICNRPRLQNTIDSCRKKFVDTCQVERKPVNDYVNPFQSWILYYYLYIEQFEVLSIIETLIQLLS